MAYKILKKFIADRRKTNEELAEMADVYYATGRLADEEYAEIIELINTK